MSEAHSHAKFIRDTIKVVRNKREDLHSRDLCIFVEASKKGEFREVDSEL